jgi:hypothetical protein
MSSDRSRPADAMRRNAEAARAELRRRLAATTMSERVGTAIELSDLAHDLRRGVELAKRAGPVA